MLHPLTLQIIDCDITPTTPAMCSFFAVASYHSTNLDVNRAHLLGYQLLHYKYQDVDQFYKHARAKASADIISSCKAVANDGQCALLCSSIIDGNYKDVIRGLDCNNAWFDGVTPLLPPHQWSLLIDVMAENVTITKAKPLIDQLFNRSCTFDHYKVSPKSDVCHTSFDNCNNAFYNSLEMQITGTEEMAGSLNLLPKCLVDGN